MRAARTDSTHKAVTETLRRCGWLVFDCHRQPNWCDLTAYHPATGRYALIEVKGPKGRERPSQAKLKAEGWPIVTVRDVGQAALLVSSF